MIIPVKYQEGGYEIVLERGALIRAGELLDLDRKVLIVTDDGVPAAYAARLASCCAEPVICTVPQGEGSKCLETLTRLLSLMLDRSFTRGDCVAAVGGGVIGDLSGLAASLYMRGVDFYNIPTTLLSQVDSSIGGKTAIDFCGVKNIIGTFKRPGKVLIDPDLLSTLDERQFACGMAEVVKMAMTCDKALFETVERSDPRDAIEEIIEKALSVKKRVVEEDEKEKGLRRVLNFGHTLGHGVETARDGELLHGECVALGMIPMTAPAVRDRLIRLLEKLSLPVRAPFDAPRAARAILHDKKTGAGGVTAVTVKEIGSFVFETMRPEDLIGKLEEIRA